MPRKRIGEICESPELLRRLEKHYRRQPQEIRIKALRLLREDPTIRIREVAASLGCSESSVHRWWEIYRREGLDAMIGIRRPTQGKSQEMERLEELRMRLREGEFLDTAQLGRLALEVRGGEEAARSRDSLHAGESVMPEPLRSADEVIHGTDIILRFLRTLPVAGGTHRWLETFREALREMLRDVDRVTVSVNVECDVRNPETYRPELVVAQHVSDSSEPTSLITAQPGAGAAGIAGRFISEMRRRGFPTDRYHAPEDYVYFISGVAYIGTIILWRDAAKPKISERTLSLMGELEPMIVVLLSDCIARHQRTRPLDRAFHGALRTMIQEAGLTDQEARIAMLQLLGRSYKDIADLLTISLDTVGKHINSIHRKTCTHGHAEMFAKYFTRSFGGIAFPFDMT